MSRMGDIWCQLLVIALGGACVFSASCATAQITPDRTLPNNTSVTINGSVFNITGGTQAGRNLFHSFQQFSVPTGETASFNNGLDIQNIISRVTGGSASNIDGLIKASGAANLFLINPSGMIFGSNARLNIGGSFLASTASRLKFADGSEFSTTTRSDTPLLTISMPIGLQFEPTSGEIHVQGSGADREVMTYENLLLNREAGLRVKPDQTLALIGSNVALEGGILTTDGGRIELGSVSGVGLVSLTPINKGFSLSYGGVQNFGNIQLLKQAAVDASGEGGGDIQLTGKAITLTDGSQIHTITLGSKPGGTLVINAQDLVQVTGISFDGRFPSRLGTETDTNATGTAGNLMINTHQLLVENGAFFSAGTFGKGQGGHLTINANVVQVIGKSADGRYTSGLSTQAESSSSGAAGDLTINTNQLQVKDEGAVSASTLNTGKAGNLIVNAAESVQVTGKSTLLAQSQPSSSGTGGNVTINTHQLLLQDGAFVSAGTFGTGNGGNLTVNADSVQVIGKSADGSTTGLSTQAESSSSGTAGNLTINTHQLLVKDGAFVSTSTKNVGNGGNLTVNADSVQVIDSTLLAQSQPGSLGTGGNLIINTHQLLVQAGFVSAGSFGTSKGGNLTVNADDFVKLIGTSADDNPRGLSTAGGTTGAAGNLTINTRQLLVQDRGGVYVDSPGTGNAGNLTVNARSIRLDNKATLSADTQSISIDPNKEQATITISSRDLILGRGSNITTNAKGSNVIGGNINIDTDVLAAIENSFVSANSANSRGGRVIINTSGLVRSPESTITATGSDPQLDGTVKINTPDVDPSHGLVTLPMVTENTPKLVSSVCAAFNETAGGSNFVVTGRGGLPPSPDDPLTSDVVWTDIRFRSTITQPHQRKTHASLPKPQPIAIVPATGWVFNDKGEVTLISSATNATSSITPMSCPVR